MNVVAAQQPQRAADDVKCKQCDWWFYEYSEKKLPDEWLQCCTCDFWACPERRDIILTHEVVCMLNKSSTEQLTINKALFKTK